MSASVAMLVTTIISNYCADTHLEIKSQVACNLTHNVGQLIMPLFSQMRYDGDDTISVPSST